MTQSAVGSQEIELSTELILELDRPGPRYTSYPPVPYWSDRFSSNDYIHHLELASKKVDEPLSIYIHLPFCAHRCLFCGCNTVISRSSKRTDDYLTLLAREIETVAGHLGDRDRVCQFQLGGGTPTHLNPDQLSTMMASMNEHFRFDKGAELAIEAHPTVTTPAHLERLAELGFNRLSLGVQDFDPKVQETIKRPQSVEQTRSLVELARELGFGGVNLDLIYGLPHQSPQGFDTTMDEVLDMVPDRLALYSFAYLPERMRHQQLLPAEALPGPREKIELFLLARARMLSGGYCTIGFDHYALPDDSLTQALTDGTLKRSFMGYTTQEGTDLIGLGVSSISEVGGCYAQNHNGLREWNGAVHDRGLAIHKGIALSPRDKLVRQAIMDWLCKFYIDPHELESNHGPAGVELVNNAREAIKPLVAKGLAFPEGIGYRATPLGQLFARVVAMTLDFRLEPDSDDTVKVKFSQTV